jgi:predicted nucleotidyltransferase
VEAEKLADMKWKILRRRAKYMALIPYVRLVAASGSIAMGRVEETSDFDTFVITKASRIWTTRFLLTIFFDILGWRRRGKITKNRFCLNHYLTDQSLVLESRNVSTAMGYYGRLIPLLGDLGLFQKFLETNQWLGEYLEQYPRLPSQLLQSKSWEGESDSLTQRYALAPNAFLAFARLIEFLLNPFWGDWTEKGLRALQLRKIARNPLTHGSPGQVIASDQELRFHPGPQERDILGKYHQRLAQLGIEKRT